MSFFEKFFLPLGSKKNKLLPETTKVNKLNVIEPTAFSQTDNTAFRTLATFDLNVESPKYEGAIPEATIKFYPLK